MTSSNRHLVVWAALAMWAMGVLLVGSGAGAKGFKIPVDDDPSLGERTAPLVLVEVADFQ